jgi:hypothetical protein
MKIKNQICINNDCAEVIIKNRKGDISKVKIDIEDIAKCSVIKWHINKGYIYGLFNKEKISMQKFLKPEWNNFLIDHINRNPLDNRKSNLRPVNKSQNSMNRSLRSDNNSGIVGVYWDKEKKKWRAQIKIKQVAINLGYFVDIKKAKCKRIEMEKKYFGEYSVNHIL